MAELKEKTIDSKQESVVKESESSSIKPMSNKERTAVKGRMIVEYCDFGVPYVKVTAYSSVGKKEKCILIELNNSQVIDGEIIDTEYIIGAIQQKFTTIYPITLLLSISEMYKTVYSLPKMPTFRARMLYNAYCKKSNDKTEYTAMSDHYQHSLGHIFNTYFIPNNIINCFKVIAKGCNAKIKDVQLLGDFFKDWLNVKGDYAYFYIRRSVCTMILVVNNALITVFEFAFDDVSEIANMFMLVVSKHEFEFGRRKITQYKVDSDIEFDLGLGLKRI